MGLASCFINLLYFLFRPTLFHPNSLWKYEKKNNISFNKNSRFLPISSSSYFYCNKYSYVMLFLYFLKSLRTLYDTFFGSFKTYINKNFQIFTSFIQIKYMYYNNLLYIYSLFDCYLFRSLYYQYAKYLSFFNYLKHLNLKYFVYIFNLKATL